MAFMISETVLFMLISYYLDSAVVASLTPMVDSNFDTSVLETLDEDVKEERMRVENMTNEEDSNTSLKISRLRKVFPSKKGIHGKDIVATEDVSFAVGPGECFGLLGANGAGKSTTIAMCTRHLIPTAGDAFVKGSSVLGNFTKAAQNLGVVTQENALWDLLSVEAHLTLFAMLRGVPTDVVDSLVNTTIDQMELTPHRHKLSMRLIGGMKRKLCVAISLIGDPAVVLLDEPSAGLDPQSRRNLWDVILRTMSHRSVVLTTHSLEEAEALCGRIGIMVQGQLRVLGTKQRLKSRFGGGFEIAIKLKPASEIALMELTSDTEKLMLSMFASSELISNNGGVLLTFKIKRHEMNIGTAFTELEKNKVRLKMEEYSISQPTLEQVFIRTVNAHTPRKNQLASLKGDLSSPSLYMEGSARLSVSGAVILPDDDDDDNEVAKQTNSCGCESRQIKYMTSGFCFLAVCLLFFGISGSSNAKNHGNRTFAYLSFCGIISLVITCFCCCCQVCPCCKPKGEGLSGS